MKQNSIIDFFKKCYPEIITFIIFCISVITVACYHEPWYDEFQAWGIAKDNLYNIFFVIPHFEGHPPLWHLILKFFQQFFTNPEVVIKIPNLAFMIGAIAILLFKSPFPRKVKLFLPFTFFIFYQHSIVSRPYSILIFALFWAASLYKIKNEKPYLFISSLILLSLSHIYGMLLATGITLAWVIEIFDYQKFSDFIKAFLKDKRFYAMLILFFVCLAISFIIFPNPDESGGTQLANLNLYERILYFSFALISDATVTNIFTFVTANVKSYMGPTFIVACAFGLSLTYLFIVIFKKNKNLSLFLLTYVPLLVFMYFAYVYAHHIGVVLMAVIFCFWCSMDKSGKDFDFVYKKLVSFIILMILIRQVNWCWASALNDIRYQYAPSREVAKYIKENKLENYNIISDWDERAYWDRETNESYTETNVYHQVAPILINPYFNRNIFYNFNTELPGKLYNLHRKFSPENNKKVLEKWSKMEKPDISVDGVATSKIWPDYKPRFLVLKEMWAGIIYKDEFYETMFTICTSKEYRNKVNNK